MSKSQNALVFDRAMIVCQRCSHERVQELIREFMTRLQADRDEGNLFQFRRQFFWLGEECKRLYEETGDAQFRMASSLTQAA